MSFPDLPVVLQDLVIDFAWKMHADVVRKNVDDILVIKNFNLPGLFLRGFLFDPRICKHVTSPLLVYTPFWEFKKLFNTFRIQELLYSLDFRKRIVRVAGTRYDWMNSFEEHYVNILQFGMFYKMLLASNKNIWTPTYQKQLQNHSASHLI